MLFWIHTISSVIASILIIWLALSCLLKRIKGHLIISLFLVLTSIVSLVSCMLYGFSLSLSLDWANIHYLTGFASLTLSLIPMLALITKNDVWHHRFGYAAAVLVVISLVTGLVAYWEVIASYFISGEECFESSQLNNSPKCLVAIDGLVHDMTNMPKWEGGEHYGHICGGNYSKEEIIESIPSHAGAKYYGPIIGRLC